jgi:MYXO-CTERM domain-containing protein
MTLRARSCAVALIVTAGVALYTESAHADAAAGAPMQTQCNVALAASPSTVVLPANAPALLAVERVYGATSPTIDAAFVDGATRTDLTAGKDSHGLLTLALPSPSSAPGSYSVEVVTSCPAVPEEQKLVTALTLTAPVAFPTSVGTLVHVPSDPPSGVDKVRLEPTEGMRAFLPAAQLDLVVGGVKSGSLTFVNAQSAIELQVNTGDACIENGALHRDKRIVKVTLDGAIAGVADSPASASLEVSVDCGAIKWTSGVVPPGVDGEPATTGANGVVTPTQEASSSDGGGCSTSPIGTQHSGPGLIALAMGGLGLVAMRRRRKTA